MGMSLAWTASPRLLLRYTLLGIFNAIIPPILVYLSARLVNVIAGARLHSTKFQDILLLIIGLWITVIIQRSVGAYIGYGRNLFVRRVELEAERRLLSKAATIDMGHFDSSDWHDRLSRAKRDVNWRPGDLTWSILGLSGNIITIILMAGLLATLHWLLVVLALSASILSLIIESRITSRLYKYFYKETPEERERQYIGDMFTLPKSIKEIRAFVLGNYLLGRHLDISKELFSQREKIYAAGGRTSMISGIVSGTILGIAYVFVAFRGIAGSIDPGGVVLVIGAFTAVSETLGQITSTFVAVDQHTAFLDDYFSFLHIGPLLSVPKHPTPLPSGNIRGITFEKISFTYPGGKVPALDGLSLQIRSGELIALVGENGAGKSTLAKLLLRFYDVDRGVILIDGIDVKDMDPDVLRSRIGILFQDYATYELSVRENIVLGSPYAEVDEERIAKSLKDSRSEEVVRRLPNGLKSKVGRLFEGSHDLSGGEWQRLALARIMYRNSDIWVLDEPTSSLDPEAEAAIFAELKENIRGRIGIVISHRFSTVRMADRIAVIADGRVTELGSHEELLAVGGRYAELFELQAASYR